MMLDLVDQVFKPLNNADYDISSKIRLAHSWRTERVILEIKFLQPPGVRMVSIRNSLNENRYPLLMTSDTMKNLDGAGVALLLSRTIQKFGR